MRKYKLTVKTLNEISADMTHWAKQHNIIVRYKGSDWDNRIDSSGVSFYTHEFSFLDKQTLLDFVLRWVDESMEIIDDN